jgi:hypothetical protein
MGTDSRASTCSPPLVALAAWLLPGAGYLLIGQRGRALGVGITIIVLFVAGLLIGGVRVIEVPGFEVATGAQRMVQVMTLVTDPETHRQRPVPAIDPATNQPLERWILLEAPLSEIRDKPWSVPQILAGPIAIVSGYFSVEAASFEPAVTDSASGKAISRTSQSIGAITHARINEIGSLYLSVAGLLNLMAIIDATWRASHLREQQTSPEETA